MSDPSDQSFAGLTELDRAIHEPARLAIMAVLAGCESADFEFLLNATGLNKGNLSAHAIKLEQAGYVKVDKTFRGKVPSTSYSLTAAGRKALEEYRQTLKKALG